MATLPRILRSIALGLALTIPFIVMELLNRINYSYNFPFVLFIVLWLLASGFAALITSVYPGIIQGNMLADGIWKPTGKVVLLLIIILLWLVIVIDQMPCFLGVANCD
jgi:hypothetical protein